MSYINVVRSQMIFSLVCLLFCKFLVQVNFVDGIVSSIQAVEGGSRSSQMLKEGEILASEGKVSGKASSSVVYPVHLKGKSTEKL